MLILINISHKKLNKMEEKEDNKEKKSQNADEIARIMVENMKANMNDPDFLDRKERIRDEVTHEVLKKLRQRKENEKNIRFIVSKINDISLLKKHLIELEHTKVRSFTECPKCGERINNGFFTITKHPTWNSAKQSLKFYYLTLHYLEDHEIYPEFKHVQLIIYSEIKKMMTFIL